MEKIGKDIKVITYETMRAFENQLPKGVKSSIFRAYFMADKYDENGNEGSDNKLTGNEIAAFWKELGNDVKSQFETWYKQREVVEEIINGTQCLNTDAGFNTYDKNKYNKAIKKINTNNIEDVVFDDLTSIDGEIFVRQLTKPSFKDQNSNEYYHPRSTDEIMKDCKLVRKVLQKWCKKHGIDTSELDKQDFKIEYGYTDDDGKYVNLESPKCDSGQLIKKYVELMYDYRDSQKVKGIMTRDVRDKMQKAIDKRYTDALATGEELTTDKPAQSDLQLLILDNRRLNKKLNKLNGTPIEENNIKYKKEDTFLNDSGNGKFDKPAMQQSGNCWLHAGINALVSTEFGREFLERNIIKDEEKHIFAIHLQEAENACLPRPNGDGIYILTEKEVLDSQHQTEGLTSGEGDVAAYALAIDRYLEELMNGKLEEGKKHFTDSNANFRFFEIATGIVKYLSKNPDMGILHQNAYDIGDNEHRLDGFDKVLELSINKKAAIILGNQTHSFSVVGSDGTNILIQESNLSDSYKDKFELIEDSFPPTYKVSREVFEKEFKCYSALKWE